MTLDQTEMNRLWYRAKMMKCPAPKGQFSLASVAAIKWTKHRSLSHFDACLVPLPPPPCRECSCPLISRTQFLALATCHMLCSHLLCAQVVVNKPHPAPFARPAAGTVVVRLCVCECACVSIDFRPRLVLSANGKDSANG